MTRTVRMAALTSLSLFASCTFTFLLSPGSGVTMHEESAVRAVVVRDEGDDAWWLCVQLAAHEPPWLWMQLHQSPAAADRWRAVATGELPPPRARVEFPIDSGSWCEVTLRDHRVVLYDTGEATAHAAVREGPLTIDLPGAVVEYRRTATTLQVVSRLALAIAFDIGLVALIVAL